MAFWPRTEIWKKVFKQRCLGQEKGTIPQLQSQLFNSNIIYMQKTSESLQNWSQWSKGDIRASEVQADIEIRNPGCSSAAVEHQNCREQNRGLTVPGRVVPREWPYSLSLTDQGVMAVRTQWSDTETSWETEQAGKIEVSFRSRLREKECI